MSGYAIRGGEEGRRRLDLLARTMAPNTEALLARAGLRAGMRCIDLGCGGGHVSRYLAECVGAGGFVVGVDVDDALYLGGDLSACCDLHDTRPRAERSFWAVS